MSEDTARIALTVNGVAHDLELPAATAAVRRAAPRPAAHRHPRRLRARRLRRVHGARRRPRRCGPACCSRCTADGAAITTVEGCRAADGALGAGAAGVPRVPRRCSAASARPGFITTVTACLRENPSPTREEAREMVAGNLCRCTGYQQHRRGRRARRGARRVQEAGRRDSVTTKLFGERVPRVEDQRFLRGHGRYVDDLRDTTTLEAAFVRSPHAHARIARHRRDRRARRRGRRGDLHLRGPRPRLAPEMAEPLPLLIPHPDLTHGRTQYALATDEVNHVGEAVAMVVAERPLRRRGRADRIEVDYELLPAVVGIEAARAPSTWCTTTCPATSARRDGAADRRRRGRHRRAPRTASSSTSPSSAAPRCPWRARASLARWDADDQSLLVYTSTQTSTGVRQAIAAKLGLPVDQVEVITPDVGGGFGVKIVHPWPEEVLVPWAARRLGRSRSSGPRTAASTSSPPPTSAASCTTSGRLRRRRPAARAVDVTFWHDNGAYTPYGLIVPIITAPSCSGPYKPGRLPGRVRRRSTPTPSSSRRTAAPAGRRAASSWSG